MKKTQAGKRGQYRPLHGNEKQKTASAGGKNVAGGNGAANPPPITGQEQRSLKMWNACD